MTESGVSIGDQVWVRTGLTGTHEEPATVTDIVDRDSSSDASDDDSGSSDDQRTTSVVVKYNVSAIEEAVSPNRVRIFDDESAEADGHGGRRGRRKRGQPDRFGSAISASAASSSAATTNTTSADAAVVSSPPTVKSTRRGRAAKAAAAAAVTPSPAESPVPISSSSFASSSLSSSMMEVDDDSGSSSSNEPVMMSRARRRTGGGPGKKAAATASSSSSSSSASGGKKKDKAATASSKKGKSKQKKDNVVPSTPPPRKRKARGSLKNDSDYEQDGNEGEQTEAIVESPYFSPPEKKKAKTSSKTSKAAAAKSKKSGKKKEPAAKTKKADAAKTKKAKRSKSATTSASSSSAAASAASSSSSAAAASSASRPRAGQPDGNGGLDQPIPFRAEYSPSGRATCRRCDEKILKGELRIGHTPLFRGKPGYTVYRHLKCAVFSEHILCAEDVDGHSDLEPDDYDRLVQRVKDSVEEIEKEREELEPDELVQVKFEGEIRSAPPGLAANLLPFQVEGASWMYHQEVKEPEMRGGVLADEMGMGKTLQTIVATLDNRPKLQHALPGSKHPPCASNLEVLKAEEKLWDKGLVDWKHEMEMNNVPKTILPKARKKQSGGGARAGTLVVCPVIALTQWKTEIEKFTEAGSLSVCIYHGPDRASDTPREMLRKYDVVLTTYQVLEADMRKMVSPNKIKCPNCGGKFKIDKLRIHLKYFCGEGAQRTEAQARTHRNNDRGGRGGGRGRGGGAGSSKKGKGAAKKSFKKSFTDEKKKSKTSSKTSASKRKGKQKSTVRVKGGQDYESESDLSIDAEAAMTPSPRGSSARSAAKLASKRMASSASTWMEKGAESDDEYYGTSDSEKDDDESFDEEDSGKKKRATKTANAKKTKQAPSDYSDESDDGDDDSSSDEDIAVKRAREKQRKALEAATKKSKKCKPSKKKASASKKGQKAGGKKKKVDDDDLDSSDDSSSDSDRDPLDGIDMDALMEEAMAGSQMSVLHSLCWWRIVLDEAHFIKSRSSQTSNAAFALIGIHRWCLSGTPLQNRVGEFYSLIRFLRIDPMAHYFCKAKGCDCKSLHYRMMNGKCQGCGHGSIQHYSHFNKYVLNPIQRDGYSGDGRRAMFVLKNEVLDKCLLRRTKETKAEDMNLPPRLVTIRPVRLHPVEEDFYNALYTQTKTSFDDYDASGNLRNNYAHVFDLLMRLRQSVDHPYLVVYSKKDNAGVAVGQAAAGPAITNGSADCDICHEPPTDRVVSSCCQAGFCRGCVLEYLSTLGEGSTPCPSCRAPFTIDLNQVQHDLVDDTTLAVEQPTKSSTSSVGMPALKELTHVASGSILRRINLAEFATSTKIEALTEELVRMRQTSPGSKAIVFSQFVNMLDLIRWRLHSDPCLADMGLGARALHGGMDVKARDAALKDFREDNNVRVLLMSLKAGGVALNLTVANHLYLMDPWWNPAAEMQAIDRTHRLGQYRPIRAVRFIAENTVEERILQLQEKKRLVFDGTVGRDAGSLKMLSVDDMKNLFN